MIRIDEDFSDFKEFYFHENYVEWCPIKMWPSALHLPEDIGQQNGLLQVSIIRIMCRKLIRLVFCQLSTL